MPVNYEEHLPDGLSNLPDPQTDIPRIAKDPGLLAEIEAAVQRIQTTHHLLQGDSRDLSVLDDHSVHLIRHVSPLLDTQKVSRSQQSIGCCA